MLLSRTLLLLLFLGSFCLQLHTSSTGNFEICSDSPSGSDTTSCLEEFLIDLGSGLVVPYGESIFIYVLTNRVLDGDEQWLWSDPTGLSCLMCTDPIYSPTESTILTLTITDGDGCIASAELPIEVILKDDIFVPNVFSPNNNGVNDNLIVFTGPGVKQINSMRIFSRKGDLVFDAYSFLGNSAQFGWDGQFEGMPLQVGVYVYLMEVESVDGNLRQLTGTINLVR